MDLDRAFLTNNLRLQVNLFDHSNATLYVDLYNTNDVVVRTNLFGNLLCGSNISRLVCLDIPLASVPAAVGIHMRRGTGEVTVRSSLLYIDQDNDGLDVNQEAQLGTSDLLADSDNDGYSDFDEVNAGTDPLNPGSYPNPDADSDGLLDAWELLWFGSITNQTAFGDFDRDGFVNLIEFQRGTPPNNVTNNTSTLTWDGLGSGNWTAARWLGGPPTYPGAAQNARVCKLNNTVTVDGARLVNILLIYSNATVQVTNGCTLSPYRLVVSNGWLTAAGTGYVTSDNTNQTGGKFAYEMYTGTNTAPLGGTQAGLRKFGTGTFRLQGNNTYGGRTQLDAGMLFAQDGTGLSPNSQLFFNGGMLGASGSIFRLTGSGPGSVYWNNNGGFAAYGATLVVRLNNGAALDWSSTVGLNSKTLILSTTTADALVDFQNPLALKGNRTVQVDNNSGSTNDFVRLSGAIANGDATARSLTKTGTGWLELSGSNTFSGGLVVSAGYLRGVHGVGLPAASLLQINGGIVESQGTLTRASGNAAGKVYWAANGGFAAVGAPLSITLDSGATLNWGAASVGFNSKTLIMGSPYADNPVTLSNPIELRGNRTIQVDDNANTLADIIRLTGILSNGDTSRRSLTKTGSGVLELTAINTYTGTNFINGGVLRAVDGVGLPTNGSVWFNGGVLESSGTFARFSSKAAGNVYWAGNGGFAAQGGPLTVTLDGGAKLNWGSSSNAGFNGKTLVLGSSSADNVVELTNPIDLRANRTIQVDDNRFSASDYARLSGILANGDTTARTLTKTGAGLLELANTNTYSGTTTISAGELRVKGALVNSAVTVSSAAARLSGAGRVKGITVNAGAILAPGNNGVGELVSTGNVSLANSAIYEWELGGGSNNCDTVRVFGNVTLTAGWKLRFKDAGGTAITNDQFTLFKYTGTATLGTNGFDTSLLVGLSNCNVSAARVINDTAGKRVYVCGLAITAGGTGGDADADGLPDAWELLKFGNLTQTGAGDFDGDGISNLLEYQRGTEPNDALSVNITLYANVATGDNAYDGLRATWDGTHGPKKNVDNAMAASLNNDTIAINPGTYAEASLWSLGSRNIRLVPTGTVVIQ